MRIYSMTATFGKLEHETLRLEPGLNIIEAPNEWGKSTWCAFLVTMLYGLETRAKSTKTALADKERFAPWSGSPMAGRIDLEWEGRNITIERSTKGRTPLGQFRAYETDSGLEVSELTAANCGQQLLGVERSVFTRAGFLRFSDLPVTNDEALRHRLNALVTTGDESGAAENLGQKLRDLKNKCRYNRSGLLPQAESQRQELQDRLRRIDELAEQCQRFRMQQTELENRVAALKNHKAALDYAAAQEDQHRVADAAAALETARSRHQAVEQKCAELPDWQTAQQRIRDLTQLKQEQAQLRAQEQMLPGIPEPPCAPEPFRDMEPEAALSQAKEHKLAMDALQATGKKYGPALLAAGGVLAVLAVVLMVCSLWAVGVPALVIGAGLLIAGAVSNQAGRRQTASLEAQRQELCRRYGNDDPSRWVALAEIWQTQWQDYERRLAASRQTRGDLERHQAELARKLDGQDVEKLLAHWQDVAAAWEELNEAHGRVQQAQQHLQALQAMAKTVAAPTVPDALTLTEAETNRMLADATYEQHQLHQRLGQCQGQMETIGSADAVRRELERVENRIAELERTYSALERAQKALTTAAAELQRRFAPRITQGAQELFHQLTGGRYDRLTLAEDLSVHAGAQGEDTLRSQLWRSDGTVDQLYLALRLAVAQELTPEAPLVLDDALVRFDDRRLAAALDLLRKEAQQKQVILFTCQGREKSI